MTKKKPKSVSDDIDVIAVKYPSYKIGYFIEMNIELMDHYDHYDYHDAPSSVTIQIPLDDLRIIKTKIDQAIVDAEKYKQDQLSVTQTP